MKLRDILSGIRTNRIGTQGCADATATRGLLTQILTELRELRSEVKAMADGQSKSFDQAVDDLGGAVTGKIAEDQVLRQQAAAGRNDAADIQKVEDLSATLNKETADEKAEAGDGSAPAAAAAAAGPTENVTVTGKATDGQTVPEAPVDHADNAPATQQVPDPTAGTTQQ